VLYPQLWKSLRYLDVSVPKTTPMFSFMVIT